MSEENLKAKYQGLQKNMEGEIVNIFAQIIKSLTNVNITVPGRYLSAQNKKSIDVSVGPKQGPLFILNQSLFFA